MATAGDIITIDNFEEKLSRWDPTSPNQFYALVDMGSNGIRFSISDLSPPRTRLLKCVYRERAAISLFDALNKSSSEGQATGPLTFPQETIKLVSQTLARFWSIAVDDYGVPPSQVAVFATEAMRRAQNAGSMLDAIKAVVPDLVVHILAPQVETLFGAVGARSGFVDVKGLFLDLGGGSVQMAYMDSYAARVGTQDTTSVSYEVAAALAGESLPFGAARLIKILDDADTEVKATEISKLQAGMVEAFRKLRAKFPSLAATVTAAQESEHKEGTKKAGIDVYLCGGGFRGYGSMLMHTDSIQPYPIPSIGTYTVSGKAFSKTKELLKVNKNFDGKIFGMSRRRRAQFPAIVTVVDALIAALPRIRSVTFCAGGNREGALMMKFPREIRDADPLACLVALIPSGKDAIGPDFILKTMLSALPDNFSSVCTTTVFGLQLGDIYANRIWSSLGQDADSNASSALHGVVTANPGCPGLTHLTRAVLGLTMCARWGSNFSPIDQQLYRSLRALVDATDPDASFWAEYIGAVSAALAAVVTRWPRNEASVTGNIKFQCTTEKAKKFKIFLDISISEKASKAISTQDLIDTFRKVGKKDDSKKVVVTISQLS